MPLFIQYLNPCVYPSNHIFRIICQFGHVSKSHRIRSSVRIISIDPSKWRYVYNIIMRQNHSLHISYLSIENCLDKTHDEIHTPSDFNNALDINYYFISIDHFSLVLWVKKFWQILIIKWQEKRIEWYFCVVYTK